ncbi:MAG: hypothetical protein ABUL68_01175 [Pseudomonadota bacterium]
MKQVRLIAPGFLFLLLLNRVWPAEGAPASAIAARVKQTQARIEVLFRHRDDAPAPLVPNQNPFRTSSDAPDASTTPTPSGQASDNLQPSEPTSDDVLLKRAVATLKISGTVVIGGKFNVSINQQTYKEGGSIIARVQGTPVILRVVHITAYNVTFSLNASELTQSF